MRAFVLALLLVLPLLPAGTAQEAPLLTDAEGDPVLAAGPEGGVSQPVPAAIADGVDLVSLDVVETDDALDFRLRLASLESPVSRRQEVHFTWRDVDHMLGFYSWTDATGKTVNRRACLYTVDEGDQEYVSCGNAIVDAGAQTLVAPVPKHYILDGKQRMPLRGDTLTGIRVVSSTTVLGSGFGLVASATDSMPDDEGGAVDLTLERGDFASGHLRLVADDRVRVSNGGATTFVYRVTVQNSGETTDEVEIAAVDLPEGWSANVQSPLRVPAKGERVVPVLASMPFAHEHGGFSAFNVTVRSASDPDARAQLRLGVLHTPIPQPAGHHPDLFLHGQTYAGGLIGMVFPWTGAFMNTDPVHDADPEEIPAGWGSLNDAYWWVGLNPPLAMGLDFDLERVGTLAGKLVGRHAGEARLHATLYLYDSESDEETALAEAEPVDLTLDPTTPVDFSLTLVPTEASDYVPYHPRQSMSLSLRLERTTPSPASFTGRGLHPSLVVADWKMTLPLNEYHDKLTGVAEEAGSVQLVAKGPVEKLGRPGTTVTYAFDLKADRDGTYDVDVAGSDAALADLVPREGIELAKGESRTLTLAVRIPAEAASDDQLEVLLFAHDREDPARTAIARTKTTVTLGGEAAPDEEDVFLSAQEAEKDTPAPGLALALGAVALAGLVLRRRRA